MRRLRERDYTRGNLLPSLVVLALPLMLSSIFGQALFQLVDMYFISRLGEAPLAAVIMANQSLRHVFLMVVMGGSFGAQALIARAIGEGRVDAAEHVAGQLVLLGLVFSIFLALVGGLFAESLFQLSGPNPDFVPYGVPYVRLTFLLSFGLVGGLVLQGILVGTGDTTTPLALMLFQTAVGLFAEWCLIFGHLGAPALGVRGVALGVAIGQVGAMGLGLVVLFRGGSRVHLRRRHMVPDLRTLRQILALAWPPALQMVGGVFTTVVFLRLARDFGESVQAAYAIGLRLGMVVPMFCFPMATACATLVGQALGSGNVPRAWRAVGVGLAVHICVMMSMAVLTLLFRHEIVSFFSDDAEVIRVGAEYLVFASGSFMAWAFFFVFLRSLQGAGDVFVPMVMGLCNTFLFTVPLGYVLARHSGLGQTGIWVAFLAGNVTNAILSGAWLSTGRWTRRALVYLPPATPPGTAP